MIYKILNDLSIVPFQKSKIYSTNLNTHEYGLEAEIHLKNIHKERFLTSQFTSKINVQTFQFFGCVVSNLLHNNYVI